MISTIVIPVAAITDMDKNLTIYNDSNVPVWNVGDEWTYNFIESRSQMVNFVLSGEFTFKVVEDTGDSYVLIASTRPYGSFDMGGFELKATFLTKISFRLQVRKNDLALENYLYKIKGLFLLKIGLITLPIPIQVEGNQYIEFDPSWPIIPFPLYDGKSGTLEGTEIFHINLYMGMFWGLIPVYGPQNISFPYTPIPYTCFKEHITVEAGEFDVYNVSAEWMDGSRFESCYCEEVGNVVKEVILIPFGGGRVQYSLVLELKDYSYTA
jgi:hypothetical protein